MSQAPKQLDRRRLIIGAGALAVIGYATVQAGWLGRILPAKALQYQPINNPPGFRKLPSGAVTAGFNPFIGLDGPPPQALLDAEQQVSGDICSALYGDKPGPDAPVQIAYFFDYQCPICRRLTPRLRALTNVEITWHDLAALGPTSEMAARASIASGFQGAYDQFHDRLMRARFLPNEGYVLSVANSVGVDAQRLVQDMQSDAVTRQMWLSRATADVFGMVGTPGLVVGRTVVIGDINDRDLARVIAMELKEPGVCG